MACKKDKDASAGEKLLRMYQMLFAEDKKHFQVELAKLLNCSSQTIGRYAEEIEKSCPDCFQTGREKGMRWFRLKANHKNTLGLDYEELHYLSLCRELSKAYIPQEIVQRIDKTLFQLSATLLEQESVNKTDLGKIVSFYSKGNIDYSEKTKIIEDILYVLKNHHFCNITYSTNNRHKKTYTFVPKQLIAMNSALYVYGAITNEAATELKHTVCLAIHRIQKLEKVNQTSSVEIPVPNKDTFGLPWHEPKTFTIHFKHEVVNYIQERIWSENQQIEEQDDGSIKLTISTTSEPELMAWVRSFGDNAQIIKQIN